MKLKFDKMSALSFLFGFSLITLALSPTPLEFLIYINVGLLETIIFGLTMGYLDD